VWVFNMVLFMTHTTKGVLIATVATAVAALHSARL
jgi:hypothetical protein